MYNHSPDDYICPFCLVSQGIETDNVLTKQDDIIYRDNLITVFISAACWKNNKGHVIVIPNQHYENIYDLPDIVSTRVHNFEKEIALALKKVYKCDGVSSRQHNEPCGNQDVWHYHLHVFPRYAGDDLYKSEREFISPEERHVFADRLRSFLLSNKTGKPMMMSSVLVFIDGTICDTRHRNQLFGSSEFYSDENIMHDIPTQGSVSCINELSDKYKLVYIGARPERYLSITEKWIKKAGFPDGAVYLGENLKERLNIVKRLQGKQVFKAGIGDRWDDNELHLTLGCMSIILKEYEPNWDTVRYYLE